MPYILIEQKTYGWLEEYAAAAGLTPEEAIKQALREWRDIIGDPVLEHLKANPVEAPPPEKTTAPVIEIPHQREPDVQDH